MNRRTFLRNSALVSVTFSLPQISQAFAGRLKTSVRLGLITDLHQDIMHDAYARLESFVREVSKQKPDAVIQLGDFAYPSPKNAAVIDLFNQSHDRTFHVIGNHDTDAGHTKAQCQEVWGIPAAYYAQELNGMKVIVLDGNETGSPTHTGGYVSYIGPAQLQWLAEELEQSELPVLIVSHQPLAGIAAIDNALEVQALLSRYAHKILLCLNGHSHIDQQLQIGQVNYLHLNSASYYWVGEAFKHPSYGEEILKAHPYIAMTCPYEDSLFAFATIDPKKMTVSISGQKSKWVGPSPQDLGYQLEGESTTRPWVVPHISNLKIR